MREIGMEAMLGSKQNEKVKRENYRDSGQNKGEIKKYEPRERETLRSQ